MPRRPRVFVEGGIYHVYSRFARGAELFSDQGEASEFIEILRKVAARDELRFFAWTQMSNHYHLALRAGPVSLSRTMGVRAGSIRTATRRGGRDQGCPADRSERRRTFTLRVVDGWTEEEVAMLQGRSADAVREDVEVVRSMFRDRAQSDP